MRPSNLYNEAIRKEIENITEEKVDGVAGSVEELATAVSTLAQTVAGIKPVPEVESTDNGKVLKAVYTEGGEGEEGVGTYGWDTANEVPTPTSADNGKVLKATYSGGAGSYAWGADDAGVKTFGGTTAAGTVVNDVITFLATDISPSVVAGDYIVQIHDGKTYIYKVTEVSGVYVYGDYTNRVQIAEGGNINLYKNMPISSNFVSKSPWTGFTNLNGYYIWTDGTNIYYSNAASQYVLDKDTATWNVKTWSGLTSFTINNMWTDGENIYFSDGTNHYVLDVATSTWRAKVWTGLTSFYGSTVWTDGDNIYYSNYEDHYVLNKATSTWSAKTWIGLTQFHGSYIWTEGDNVYFSRDNKQYVLDKATSTWSAKVWTGLTSFSASNIWTDGENIYYSSGSNQYVLDVATSTWSAKTWTGLTNFNAISIWTDGENIYYDRDDNHYILVNKLPSAHLYSKLYIK